MFTHIRRPEPADRFSWTSPRRQSLPCRLGGVLILALILTGCTLPTEDISERQVFTSKQIKQAITQSVILPKVDRDLRMLDNRYIAYTRSELISCLDSGKWIAGLKYIPEHHDCEEYMFDIVAWVRGHLHGIPFGFGLRETATCHAENLFVDDSLNVWVVDIKRHGSELRPACGAFYFFVMI